MTNGKCYWEILDEKLGFFMLLQKPPISPGWSLLPPLQDHLGMLRQWPNICFIDWPGSSPDLNPN